MNICHKKLLEEMLKYSHKDRITKLPINYSGSIHLDYNLKTSDSRQIAKDWVKDNSNIEIDDFVLLLDSLYESDSIDEKMMAGKLIGYQSKLRSHINPQSVNKWLSYLVGWAEIDSLCQSNFTYKDLFSNWAEWEKLLDELSQDKNVSKRRASIVLLTGPISHSDDERLVQIAFQNIDRLKLEKDILITKAISWLLRDMTKNHRDEVAKYLEENNETLPKIAIRETNRKLLTGRK